MVTFLLSKTQFEHTQETTKNLERLKTPPERSETNWPPSVLRDELTNRLEHIERQLGRVRTDLAERMTTK